jgi:hypothetical protein
MVADGLTKALGMQKFEGFRALLGLVNLEQKIRIKLGTEEMQMENNKRLDPEIIYAYGGDL